MFNVKKIDLVELLTVLIIIAIILSLIMPSATRLMNASRSFSYSSNEKLLINAARNYVKVNRADAPKSVGETMIIDLSELQNGEFVGTVQDLRNQDVECNGYVVTRKTDASYVYEPYIKCGNSYSTNGLVAWHPMDGNAFDLTGNDHHGMAMAVIWEKDGVHTVARFNGSSDYSINDFYNPQSFNSLFLGTSPQNSDNFNGNATYSAWVKASSLDDTPRMVLSDSNYNEGMIAFYSNKITSNWDNSDIISYNTEIRPDRWYYVVMTHEKDIHNNRFTLKLYVDGVYVGQHSKSMSQDAYYGPDSRLTLGHQWIGVIDDVKIYNKVLTEKEIFNNYTLGNFGR